MTKSRGFRNKSHTQSRSIVRTTKPCGKKQRGVTKQRKRDRSPFKPHGELCSQASDAWSPVKPSKKWLRMSTCDDFIHQEIRYHLGDFIYVANSVTIRQEVDVENMSEWIAQIIGIKASGSDGYALVCWMYSPDDLPLVTVGDNKSVSGRQPYHGTRELIASNHMDVINFKSVKEHAIVHPWVSEGSGILKEIHWRQALDFSRLQLSWVHITSLWQDTEQKPLVFPPKGKNRVTINNTDISRLNQGNKLNDNTINFYIRYLENKSPMLSKVYFFNTFFYTALTKGGKVSFERVRKWTKEVDLLSYKYIIIPVFEEKHWYLAIICNAPNDEQYRSEEQSRQRSSTALLHSVIGLTGTAECPSMATGERHLMDTSIEHGTMAKAVTTTTMIQRHVDSTASSFVSQLLPTRLDLQPPEIDVKSPIIVIFDSLGHSRERTCQALSDYLSEEAKAKGGVALAAIPTNMAARGIPKQDNAVDCGAFLIGNMAEFLKNPEEAIRKIFLKRELGWKYSAAEIRAHVRDILCELRVEQLGWQVAKSKKEAL